MKGKGKVYIYLFLASLLMACQDEKTEDLKPFDERVSEAKSTLKSELTAPENGWKLEYKPTNESGTFLMLLNFDEDGNVNIKSDVAANDGEFYDHTIPYRIDNAHGLELILETYGVFHYMFELDAASFGAEFEFLYKQKEGENLVFESISDGSNPSQLMFTPASTNEEDALSRELSENLDAFDVSSPRIFVNNGPMQQLILNDKNISVFWSMDIQKRIIRLDMAGVGTTIEEIVANNNYIGIGHNTGFILLNNKLIFDFPLSFTLNGEQIEISEITLNEFDFEGPVLCSQDVENSAKYNGQIPGLGSITMINSYHSITGSDFDSGFPYSVNVFFVADNRGRSLSENGIINDKYPSASGFFFLYGDNLDNDSIPSYSIGVSLEDGSMHLRAFETTTTELNKVQINFTGNYYFTGGTTPAKEEAINAVTDEIFEGGEIYAYDLPNENLTVFRLYNPCNGYEFALVQ